MVGEKIVPVRVENVGGIEQRSLAGGCGEEAGGSLTEGGFREIGAGIVLMRIAQTVDKATDGSLRCAADPGPFLPLRLLG